MYLFVRSKCCLENDEKQASMLETNCIKFAGERSIELGDARVLRTALSASYNIDGYVVVIISWLLSRRYIATTHGDHVVRVIDTMNFTLFRELRGHPRTPWTCQVTLYYRTVYFFSSILTIRGY